MVLYISEADLVAMLFRTLRNIGEIGTEFNNVDTNGARVSRDLVGKLIDEIAKRSVSYFDSTGDHAFYYSEKQFNSVVCPAIAELTKDCFLIEQPSKRKPAGENEYSGHIDYWLYYRNYSFLLEMKHAYFAYRMTKQPRKSIIERLNEAHKQLKMVRKNECRNLSMGYGLIKIAFEAITFYEGSKNKYKKKDWEKKDFKQIYSNLMTNKELNQLTTFNSLWVLNKRLVEPYDYPDGSFEVYPAIAFIGDISEDQT